MKNLTKTFFILALGFFFMGCLASDKDMSALKEQMVELNRALATMQANQADLGAKMDELSSDISVNNENLQETNLQLTRLSSKLDDLSIATTAVAQMQAEASAKAVILPTTVFETAKVNLDDKKYDSAIEGFKLYIEKFPEGELVQEAYNLIGDAYFAKKEYKSAAIEYANLIKKYPKSKKTPSYRLKYAKSIIPLNKKTEAKQYLQSIIQDYPKSSEAKVAQRELGKLK
ncbi:Putative Tol-Pal system protein [Elusimicrobium minutum Pei191]|uniref:Putative Tol-Pal system protein n=1 Tax=Elusimicrobium minutum (strain Pei191) TaxID=445932 RepID=B2KE82_ELUMP|nr:tol-pal system protein YbgF [Elusimicrobium minutum]ACC98828.1 Putative Tol-Pal system protein [Elusimicrobium minutum Pei191]